MSFVWTIYFFLSVDKNNVRNIQQGSYLWQPFDEQTGHIEHQASHTREMFYEYR